jgi:hypothetical protein
MYKAEKGKCVCPTYGLGTLRYASARHAREIYPTLPHFGRGGGKGGQKYAELVSRGSGLEDGIFSTKRLGNFTGWLGGLVGFFCVANGRNQSVGMG